MSRLGSVKVEDQANVDRPWTRFELPAKNPSKLSGTPSEIGGFISASLPSMANLEQVVIAFNSSILFKVEKSGKPATPIPMLRDLASSPSPSLMNIKWVNSRELCIKKDEMVYVKPDHTPNLTSSESHMAVWTAEVEVPVESNSEFALGLEKAMKKKVPNRFLMQLIYVGPNLPKESLC